MGVAPAKPSFIAPPETHVAACISKARGKEEAETRWILGVVVSYDRGQHCYTVEDIMFDGHEEYVPCVSEACTDEPPPEALCAFVLFQAADHPEEWYSSTSKMATKAGYQGYRKYGLALSPALDVGALSLTMSHTYLLSSLKRGKKYMPCTHKRRAFTRPLSLNHLWR